MYSLIDWEHLGPLEGLGMVLLFCALYLVPMAKILQRTGNSPWYVLLYFIPGVNLIAFWAFAFGDWPIDAKLTRPGQSQTS